MTTEELTMETVPNDFDFIGDVMSNFDHMIEDGMEEKLKSGKFYGDYSAWNFHAQVWFDGKNFKAMVKRYQAHVGTITALTLEQIMELASDNWGYD